MKGDEQINARVQLAAEGGELYKQVGVMTVNLMTTLTIHPHHHPNLYICLYFLTLLVLNSPLP